MCIRDRPGGSQELGEGLTETLKREVLEETGYTISRYANPRMYDVMVQEEGKDFADVYKRQLNCLWIVEQDAVVEWALLR